ncbi:MAG: APC family permease [Eubacteriales bacterium]|nr:APC family permease [Eubacteriales bacterium]
MGEERVSLGKTLQRKDIWGFAFGSVVGWGWIMMAGNWVRMAGTMGAVIAFVIGAVITAIIGCIYAEMTPMLPLSGGVMVWSYRCSGYNFCWFTGWAICFAYLATAAFEGPAFATAIMYLFPIPQGPLLWTIAGYEVHLTWLIISLAGICGVMFLHYRGTKMAAKFNTIAAVALAIGGLIFFFGSVTLGDIQNAMPAIRDGIGGIELVMMSVPCMFLGFDVIPQASEEMDIPLKQIGWMVIFAITLGALWYIGMILGVGFAAPLDMVIDEPIPLAAAAEIVFGSKIFGFILIVAGVGGIITSWNAMFMGATRIMFAMARAKLLPEVFAKTSKYNTPYAAIMLTGSIGIIAPFLGKNAITWFVDASSLGSVVAYLCVAISFVLLRRKEPNLERPWKLPAGRLMGVLGVVSCLFFISLYMPFGSSSLGLHEWSMVILWVVIGLVLYFMNKRQKVTLKERELLLFGEEYARPEFMKDTYK